MTWASFGTLTEGPTSTILPSLISMEPCSMVPWETVRMVAFWIRITGGASGGVAAGAKRGSARKLRAQTVARTIRERLFTSIDGIFTVHPQRQMIQCSLDSGCQVAEST